jgi:hypothetical protein
MMQPIRRKHSHKVISQVSIQMEGTDCYSSGDCVFMKGSKSRYGSSSVIDLSFTLQYGENEITGYLQI